MSPETEHRVSSLDRQVCKQAELLISDIAVNRSAIVSTLRQFSKHFPANPESSQRDVIDDLIESLQDTNAIHRCCRKRITKAIRERADVIAQEFAANELLSIEETPSEEQ